MKRLAMAALAAATFAAPLALPTEAAAQHRGDRDGRWDRDGDYDNRDDRRDERRAYREGRRDGRDAERRRDYRDDRRDARRHARWDDRRYNGYSYRGQWYYGPPPAAHRAYADYNYRGWRRGDRLPRYYRDRYVVVRDYDRYGYRHPPRGYHYVRDDRGDLLLVGIATGAILGIIASQ
jgi:Ni/Co efflux regulator RcnB